MTAFTKELYKAEYSSDFVNRWDELINWKKRLEAENGFFPKVFRAHKVNKVLDIACGTGFHTITLAADGFDVTGADGAATMLEKARENARRFNRGSIRLVKAEWTSLTQAFPNEKFDAIICLGNAFTHLFQEEDRKKALAEIYQLLNKGGVAIIDHRNYDKILDRGYHSKHRYYYVGESVNAFPEEVSEKYVKFRYEYEDGSAYHLTLCPIRQNYITGLLREAGFTSITRYGDFEASYDHYDPDFIVQIAKK